MKLPPVHGRVAYVFEAVDFDVHQIVGAGNFGYGHPHYPATKAMRHLGIAGVIAESFFPSYFQNEINMGFPQIICPGIVAMAKRWDVLEIDWSGTRVVNHTREGLRFS